MTTEEQKRTMELTDTELEGMVQIIRNWTYRFNAQAIGPGKMYGLVLMSENSLVIHVGPCSTVDNMVQDSYEVVNGCVWDIVNGD